MISKVLFAFCATVSVFGRIIPLTSFSDQRSAVDNDLIELVNSQQTTWVAGSNAKFEGLSIGQAKSLMGTILGGPKPPVRNPVYSLEDVPDQFDARTNPDWATCSALISTVRDQSACGSCWAFGSTEAFNDRHCIQTKDTTEFAAADVLACCSFTCGDGCNGGYPQMAWAYFKRTGSVHDACYPYPFPACAHHVTNTSYPACPSQEYNTPSCPRQCTNSADWDKDKTHATSSYGVTGESNIMAELSMKGPVTAAYTVYEDFLSYKSGVYKHVSGSELGGHAVEIIGYGTDSGVKYWLVKNSWNPSWGDLGYFKILRGVDECGIESEIVTGLAG